MKYVRHEILHIGGESKSMAACDNENQLQMGLWWVMEIL